MPVYLRQSTASQEVPLGFFVDSTDGNTEETALSIANTDIKIWKTGTTTLANKNSGGATHISNGIYHTTLDATDTDTIGPMIVFCHVAGALTVRLECCVLDEAVYDALFGTVALATATNITAASGIAVSSIAAGAIDAAAIATGAIDADAIADNAIDAGAIAADAITAAKIANGAIDAATFAAGAIDAAAIANGAIDAATFAAGAIDAAALATDAVAEIADGVWDEATSGHTTLGTYGQAMRAFALPGEINDAGATTTSFIVDGFTEATNDHFNGMQITFTSGALTGQTRTITDYAGGTQTITVAEALTDTPADNDDFIISPGPMAGGTLQQVYRLFLTLLNSSGQIQAGTLATDTITAAKIAADAITAAKIATGAIDADALAADTITAAKIATGAITSAKFAAGAIDAAAIATDAIDGDALAASALSEIKTQVTDALNVDTYAEIGQETPAATNTIRKMLGFLFKAWRNRSTQTSTQYSLYNDDATTIAQKATVSDDGTTYDKGEVATGP